MDTQQPFDDIPCVILSGGKSSRMGEDKSLLPFGQTNSLIQFQYERLKPYFKNIYISSKTDKFDFIKDKSFIIYDKSKVYSPIVALKAILEQLPYQKVFIITVDIPFVKIETIAKLIKESKGFDITVARTLRTHNLCGVYDKSILLYLKQMIKDDFHKVGYLINKLNSHLVKFTDDMEFLNLNKKEEYQLAQTIISKIYN